MVPLVSEFWVCRMFSGAHPWEVLTGPIGARKRMTGAAEDDCSWNLADVQRRTGFTRESGAGQSCYSRETNSFVHVFDKSILADRTLSRDKRSAFNATSAASGVIRPSSEIAGTTRRTASRNISFWLSIPYAADTRDTTSSAVC